MTKRQEVQSKFLSLLFDPGQATCFTASPHGYKVSHTPRSDDIFFCINALHPTKDLNPHKDWHSEYLPRRSDANIVCYRNFLLELDNVPLSEQSSYIMNKIPVSSVVYSGGKSLHFIISLTEPLPNSVEYKNLALRLLKMFPQADKTCKNPSRLSRLPGVIRPETNKMQELRYLGNRVHLAELEPLLPPPLAPRSISFTADQRKNFVSSVLIEASNFPDDFMEKHDICGRNALFYYLGKRMDESNFTQEMREKYTLRTYNNLSDTRGFPLEEALAAARVKGDA